MGKKAPPIPASPDPEKTARSQGIENRETAITQAILNNTNEYTPYGNVVYEKIPGDGEFDQGGWDSAMAEWEANANNARQDGKPLPPRPSRENFMPTPRFEKRVTLNPLAQSALDEQLQLQLSLSELANGQVPRVEETLSSTINFDGLPDRVTSLDVDPIRRPTVAIPGIDDFSAERNEVQDALFERYMSRLDPRFDDQRAALETTLANQGIFEGSEAYDNSLRNFNFSRNDATQSALNESVLAGGNEQSRMFNQALAARGAQFGENATISNFDLQRALTDANLAIAAREGGIQERSLQRNQPLNDVAALLGTSQIQVPQFSGSQPVGVSPTNIAGLVGDQYRAQLNSFNQQSANANSNNQATAQLIASLLIGPGAL